MAEGDFVALVFGALFAILVILALGPAIIQAAQPIGGDIMGYGIILLLLFGAIVKLFGK